MGPRMGEDTGGGGWAWVAKMGPLIREDKRREDVRGDDGWGGRCAAFRMLQPCESYVRA